MLRHLQRLELHELGEDDVLNIGRSLRPGPYPSKWRFMCIAVSRIDGKRCTAGWDNMAIVSAFSATCLHAQLGAASWVSFLIDVALVLVADDVLGGWGLLKMWQGHQLEAEHACST